MLWIRSLWFSARPSCNADTIAAGSGSLKLFRSNFSFFGPSRRSRAGVTGLPVMQ